MSAFRMVDAVVANDQAALAIVNQNLPDPHSVSDEIGLPGVSVERPKSMEATSTPMAPIRRSRSRPTASSPKLGKLRFDASPGVSSPR